MDLEKMRSNGQQRPSNSANDAICKLFVGNVNKSTTDEDFRAYFEKFGTIKDIVLMKDNNNPAQNRGFGFVTPEAVETTDRILVDTARQLDGRDLDIKRALPKEIDDPLLHVRTPRIFLGGLPHNLTEEELTTFFNEKYGDLGNVKEVIIKKDRQSGRPRGFCFVAFENEHVVDKILIEQRYPIINNKRCEVRKADSGIPISGAPPSQLQKYPSKSSPTAYSQPRGQPQQSRPRYGGPQSMGGSGMQQMSQSGSMQGQSMAYGSQQPQGNPNPSYNYSNYSQQPSQAVAYPPSNAYYNYYPSSQGIGGSSYPPQSNGQVGAPAAQYGSMQDQRMMKPGYVKPTIPAAAVVRGRPY